MGIFGRRRRERAEAEAQARIQEFAGLQRAEQLRTILPQLRTALDRTAEALGEGHDLTLRLWGMYGLAISEEGRHEDAVTELGALAKVDAVSTIGRAYQMVALSNLSVQLAYLERFEEACEVARPLLDEARSLPRPADIFTRLSALNTLSMALVLLGRPAEGERTAREALTEAAASDEPVGNFERGLRVNLASALNAQRRYAEALDVLADAVAVTDPAGVHAGASAVGKARATALLGLGRRAEAASAAQAGLTSALLAYGETHTRVRGLRALLADATE
jgi:tetratricopeptide (TPR) repeat protein